MYQRKNVKRMEAKNSSIASLSMAKNKTVCLKCWRFCTSSLHKFIEVKNFQRKPYFLPIDGWQSSSTHISWCVFEWEKPTQTRGNHVKRVYKCLHFFNSSWQMSPFFQMFTNTSHMFWSINKCHTIATNVSNPALQSTFNELILWSRSFLHTWCMEKPYYFRRILYLKYTYKL